VILLLILELLLYWHISRFIIIEGNDNARKLIPLQRECHRPRQIAAFYEMIGFKVIVDFREGMSSPELATALGLPHAQLRGVHLSTTGEPTLTRIDLVEFQEPKTEGKPYPHLHHAGINRVSIRTKNIKQMYEDLKAMGSQLPI
jgi:hypothetical protein